MWIFALFSKVAKIVILFGDFGKKNCPTIKNFAKIAEILPMQLTLVNATSLRLGTKLFFATISYQYKP